MTDEPKREFVASDLARSPVAFRLYRSAEQQALHQKVRLTPDQWAQLLQALSAFGMALLRIFIGEDQVSKAEPPPGGPGGGTVTK